MTKKTKKTEFPILYHKTAKGSINIWSVWAEGSKIYTRWGQQDGKIQTSCKEVVQKNVGRANETSVEEQAVREAESMWTFKKERKYSETLEETKETIFLPMLAKDFEKRKRLLGPEHYPVFGQPKFDGCVFHSTVLETNEGKKTIKEIVDNRLRLDVLSYNKEKNLLEFKPILNWFNNGTSQYKNWMEIIPEFGEHIKCTKNHKIATNFGFKRADELNPEKDLIIQTSDAYRNSLLAGTLLGDSCMGIDKRGAGRSYRLVFQHTNRKLFDFKVNLLGVEGKTSLVKTGYGSTAKRFVSTALTTTNFPIQKFYFTGHHKNVGKRKVVGYKTLKQYLSPEAVSLWIADDGSLQLNNSNKYTPRLYISTHNHSEQQIREFVKYFQKAWGCSPSIHVDKRVRNRGNCPGKFLTFSTKDTLLVLNKLRKYHCHGVEYKYYFQTEGFVPEVGRGHSYSKFRVRFSRNMPDAVKYDIEVKDNHNYLANSIVVHNCRTMASWVGTGKNKRIKLTSRGGKEYILPHLCAELEKTSLPDGDVLDGELYVHGMGLQEINHLVRGTKNIDTDSVKIEYHVYDYVAKNLVEGGTWLVRRTNLDHFFKNNRSLLSKVKLVHGKKLASEGEVYAWHDECVENGYEGAIVRLESGKYKFGYRSADLLKVKAFKDEEFEITGFTNGIGKFSECIIFECKTKHGGSFTVVPKGTFEQRAEWLKQGKSFIGRWLKVQFFDYTEDNIPQFPVGLAVRLEEDMD